jgi:urease accessory protein
MSAAISLFEIAPALLSDTAAPALQRGDGAAEIGFVRHGRDSMLSHLYQRAPCRVMFPNTDPGEPPLAIFLTTSGGVAGGDRLRFSVAVEAGAAATIATAAAEKIYRSLGADSAVSVELRIGEGAWLEWLPQETILFDGARLRRGIEVSLAPTGRLLAAEMVVFGRAARGERFRRGLLAESWRIERGGRLAWYDATRLDGDVGAIIDRPAAFAGADAFATVVYAGADAARHLGLARELAAAASCRAGASLVNGLLLGRFLGDAASLRAALGHYVGGMRQPAAGLAPHLPRQWGI